MTYNKIEILTNFDKSLNLDTIKLILKHIKL
jgi:hypothetical protein